MNNKINFSLLFACAKIANSAEMVWGTYFLEHSELYKADINLESIERCFNSISSDEEYLQFSTAKHWHEALYIENAPKYTSIIFEKYDRFVVEAFDHHLSLRVFNDHEGDCISIKFQFPDEYSIFDKKIEIEKGDSCSVETISYAYLLIQDIFESFEYKMGIMTKLFNE